MSDTTRVESFTVRSDDEIGVKLRTKVFKQGGEGEGGGGGGSNSRERKEEVIVMVHPHILRNGNQKQVEKIAKSVVSKGYMVVTFDMRGVGKSTGVSSLRGNDEVSDVRTVCKWVCRNMSAQRILLVGCSTGAPIAGSALDKEKEVFGFVGISYPFGRLSSFFLGIHHKPLLSSLKPKLFIMGEQDGFTSPSQLRNKIKASKSISDPFLIPNCGHFPFEDDNFVQKVADRIHQFILNPPQN